MLRQAHMHMYVQTHTYIHTISYLSPEILFVFFSITILCTLLCTCLKSQPVCQHLCYELCLLLHRSFVDSLLSFFAYQSLVCFKWPFVSFVFIYFPIYLFFFFLSFGFCSVGYYSLFTYKCFCSPFKCVGVYVHVCWHHKSVLIIFLCDNVW